jgi:tetratricopeptide (TPR) repeat protein
MPSSIILKPQRLDPKGCDARQQAGLLLASQGRLPEARSNFEEVIQLHPTAETYYHLALVFSNTGPGKPSHCAISKGSGA